MSMKKHNRNIFAYLRQPSPSNQEIHCLQEPHKQMKSTSNQNIYNAIINQMEPEDSSYINKLIIRTAKEDEKQKAIKSNGAHQRTKSYADILVGTPTTSKNVTDGKGYSHRQSKNNPQIRNIFFSSQNTPTNQKPEENKSHFKTENPKKENSFLSSLNSYINGLVNNEAEERRPVQRRTVLKSRQSSSNIRVIHKLEEAEKTIKELKLKNHILESENLKLKKNLKTVKQIHKINMEQILKYAKELNQDLKHEKSERRKIEEIVVDLQRNFLRLKPERKTMADLRNTKNLKIYDLLLSDSTEQDEVDFGESNFMMESRPSSSKRKRVEERKSKSRHSRMKELMRDEFNSMFGEKNQQIQEESSQVFDI